MPGVGIKKNDEVEVIAGKDRGKRGRVIHVLPDRGRVMVDGVARARKATRTTGKRASSGQALQQGGIIDTELFIDISNVMVVCKSCGKASRVGYRVEDGVKARYCRRCEAEISTMASASVRTKAPEPRLKVRYHQELRPQLMRDLSFANPMQVPRLEKIVVNMGVGDAVKDAKLLDAAVADLAIITGQKAAIRRARKSIAAFKLREGMPIGAKVTLRGARMWEFLDRLLSTALPRIRDFRGLNPDAFDGHGNYSIGVTEQLIFPEIDYDQVVRTRGMDITIVTTAATNDEARVFLRALGFPFAGSAPVSAGAE